jgi:prepilin-type N-terminal cleavage/methylation domain-containing protein
LRRIEGFSLMELMIVLTVAGIVMAFGLPAFTTYRNTLDIRQARQQLIEDLRGARQYAVTRRAPVYVDFRLAPDTTRCYQILVDTNANGQANSGERLIRRTLPGKTTFTSVLLTPADRLVFDISGILFPGTAGGMLVFRNQKDKRDTLVVSAAGIAYRP